MRLQQFLAQAGVASRRAAEKLITEGKVTVNGQAVAALGSQVNPRTDRVEVEGRRVRPEEPLYRVILKPRACLATLAEGEERPTLARYVPDREIGWKVVAPLDFPAEGVVLLTTDGVLAERMSRGGGKVPMTYHLKMQGPLSPSELERFKKGWKWNGRPVRPESVEALATTGKNTWIEVVVAESRPRVLKAAGELLRHTVLKISRVRLGIVSFEGLAMGQSRELTRGEVNALRTAVGLDAEEGTKPVEKRRAPAERRTARGR
jgi:23S rRNA pseudouridine2605 synthase